MLISVNELQKERQSWAEQRLHTAQRQRGRNACTHA